MTHTHTHTNGGPAAASACCIPELGVLQWRPVRSLWPSCKTRDSIHSHTVNSVLIIELLCSGELAPRQRGRFAYTPHSPRPFCMQKEPQCLFNQPPLNSVQMEPNGPVPSAHYSGGYVNAKRLSHVPSSQTALGAVLPFNLALHSHPPLTSTANI